jgi:hypothetical protein
MNRVLAIVFMALALAGALAGVAAPVAAQPRTLQAGRDLPIAAFFGRFTGSGIAAGEDADYLGVTQRDLDVQIQAQGSGFSATWRTVLRQGGVPGSPNIRTREVSLTFAPLGRPGLFRAGESGDPTAGQPLVWARIRGSTLFIYEINMTEDGRWDVQTYARTVSGAGMQLEYTRLRDGERQRIVRGRMVKQAN